MHNVSLPTQYLLIQDIAMLKATGNFLVDFYFLWWCLMTVEFHIKAISNVWVWMLSLRIIIISMLTPFALFVPVVYLNVLKFCFYILLVLWSLLRICLEKWNRYCIFNFLLSWKVCMYRDYHNTTEKNSLASIFFNKWPLFFT